MIVNKKTISTIQILEYTFKGDSFAFPVTVKAEVMDGQIKCLIKSSDTQEAIPEKNWKVIRAFIENDVKEDSKDENKL